MNQGRRPLSSLTRSPGRGLCVQPARHPGGRPRGARPAGDDDDDDVVMMMTMMMTMMTMTIKMTTPGRISWG